MSEARDLFSQFKPRWWDSVSVRATSKTRNVLHVDIQPAIFAATVFVVMTAISAVSDGIASATVDLKSSIVSGTVSAVLYLVWWLWHVWLSANELHDEQESKIAFLEAALVLAQRKEDAPIVVPPAGGLGISGFAPAVSIGGPSLAERLIQFRIDGVRLRNEKIAVAEFDAWKARVDKWKDDVVSVISGQVNLADVARFVTLDRVAPVEFAWARDKRHAKVLRELSQRIQILLEAMARL